MTVVTNSLEGGTNNTAVSTGNSGGASGTAFGSASGATFTNVRSAHGLLSARLDPGGSGFLSYTLSGSNSTRWVRGYFYATDWDQNYSMALACGSRSWTVVLDSNVRVEHDNGSSASFIATISQAPAVNQWIRVELSAINDATGACTVSLYNSADSLTPTGTASGSRAMTATAWSSASWFNSASVDAWVDDVAWSDEGPLGPAVASSLLQPRLIRGGSVPVHHAANW